MEKNEKDRQYYTVFEITKALREYLKEGYRILYEMLPLIGIKSDCPYKVEIKIAQEDATNLFSEHIIYKDEPYNGKILLFISKSGFSPARMIRNYKTEFMQEENPLYSIDNADYIIEKRDESFVFQERYNHDILGKYRPELNIIDIDKFNILYQRLEEEGYLTYPSIKYFNHSNPYFSFVLGSQRISLEEVQTYHRCFRMEYNPSNNSLLVRDNRKDSEFTSEQMFGLKIPKDDIYKGYVSIIDEKIINEQTPNLIEESNNIGNVDNKTSKILKKALRNNRLFTRR